MAGENDQTATAEEDQPIHEEIAGHLKGVKIKEADDTASVEKAVNMWNAKADAVKAKFEKDFKRMRENCRFLAGYQWPGQKDLRFNKIVINICLQLINSISSQLYAKNPKVDIERRETMDYEVWDGTVEALQGAQAEMAKPLMAFSQDELAGQLHAKAQANVLLKDWQTGEQWRKMLDKVGKTLLKVDEWMVANQQPAYEEQLKQLVTTALVCGVAYEKTSFVREYGNALSQSTIESTVDDRMKMVKQIAQKLGDEKMQTNSPEIQTLKMLAQSLQVSAQSGDFNNMHERVCWDYPEPWSILVDPNCRNLNGFIGADWICEEQILPLDTVNAYFETEIKTGEAGAKNYGSDGLEAGKTSDDPQGSESGVNKPRVSLRHFWQLSTKNHFYIVDGYKKWVQEPEPVEPETNLFWPVRALVFNHIVASKTPEFEVSVYPPSHVDVVRDAQLEWNRASQAMRKHRQANIPRPVALSGAIDEKDVRNLANADEDEIVMVKTLQPGQKVDDVITWFKGQPFLPECSDTGYQIRDISMTVTGGEAEPAPQNHKVTATAAHIEEQKRIGTLSSNVDDLDKFLTSGAKQRGEMYLRDLTPETAKRLAGRGAVWPNDVKLRQQFIECLSLTIKAASSGRPNQALKVSGVERLMPLYLQSGGNPRFALRLILDALDENIDESQAFPMTPPQPTQGAPPQGQPHGGPQRQMPPPPQQRQSLGQGTAQSLPQ